MRKRLMILLAVLAASMAWAAQAGACTINRGTDSTHYWDGMYYYSNSSYPCIEGSQNYILARNPTTAVSGFSSAWAGTTFENGSGTDYYLGQIGWNKDGPSGSYYNFAQVVHNDSVYKNGDFTGPSPGTWHWYKVTYTYSNNTFHMFYDGTNYYNWQAPTQLGCNYATYVENSSEILNIGNQMPGESTNPEYLYYNEFMNNGGSWYHPTSGWGKINSNSTDFSNTIGTYGGYASDVTYDRCN